MPERGIYRSATVKGYATPTNAPCYVSSGDNLLHIIPAGSGTTEVIVPVATSTSGARFAAGTGTLVSGAATVATGLASILSIVLTLTGTGARATGATEVAQLTVLSTTTGAASVQGMYSTAAATWVASASGTSTFNWAAVGM
jgi:X-X-X-Leu-X-X-Gly heptad repeat protein